MTTETSIPNVFFSDDKCNTNKENNLGATYNNRPACLPHVVLQKSIFQEGQLTPSAASSPLGHLMHKTEKQKSHTDQEEKSKTTLKIAFATPLNVNTEESVSTVSLNVGKHLKCSKLISALAANYLHIENSIAETAFALWIISPLLELQLKPEHHPYVAYKSWQSFLKKFVPHVSSEEANNDEPILVFRRNVYLSAEDELSIIKKCPKCLMLLYQDAKSVLMSGRYILDSKNAATLAGIGFAIAATTKQKTLTVDYMRKNLDEQLPEYLAESVFKPVFFGKSLPSKNRFNDVETSYNVWIKKDIDTQRQGYLQHLSQTCPCYGAAFYYGTIEKPLSPVVKGFRKLVRLFSSDLSITSVRIGVNRNSITIVNLEKNSLIFAQNINVCSFKTVQNENDMEECRLLLTFDYDEKSDEEDSNDESSPSTVKIVLLQVFGAQNSLLNVILNSMKKAYTPMGIERQYSTKTTCSSREMCVATYAQGKWTANGSLRRALSTC